MAKKTNDTKIKKFLKVVEEKRKELGTKPRARWLTNGLFKSPNGNGHFNLNTVTDAERLVDALAELVMLQEARKVASRMLGLEEPDFTDFKHDGYNIGEWRDDFILRLQIVNYDKKKKELTKLEAKLKDLRSEDLKTADALDDIASMLNG